MRLTAFLSLLVFSFILAFSLQGIRGIWQPDEGYYVGVATQMHHEGQYLVPRLDEEVFLDKPPVLYWGIVSGIKFFGQSEFAVRIFPGLCFAFTVLLIFEIGRSMTNRFAEGFWSAVIYATMIIPFFAADFVTPDTPLTLFTTLSMLAFWKSLKPNAKHPNLWKMILCLAVGLGFLTKGPAALIPCGAMFVYLILTGNVFRYFLTPWIIIGLLLFLITGLGWYAYISLKLPGAAAYFFDSMIWGRLVSAKYQRNPGLGGSLIYLPILLLGTLPWSALWYIPQKGVSKYFSAAAWKKLPQDPAALLLACWIILPMLVLCLASSKLGLYALPVFPAIAIATARLLPKTDLFDRTELTFSHELIKRFSFVLLWVGLLLTFRLALAAIPSANDCRALWKELAPYLPKGDYEIVAVDERVDGLTFYGAMEVENVTRRKNPYPTYTSMESVDAESEDMLVDNYPHLFIIQGKKHLSALEKALSKPDWSTRRIELHYNRWLLLCSPSSSPQQ